MSFLHQRLLSCSNKFEDALVYQGFAHLFFLVMGIGT